MGIAILFAFACSKWMFNQRRHTLSFNCQNFGIKQLQLR
jgi:hypothetical protein